MSYALHNFTDGDVIYASPLNEMDQQIQTNETNIAAKANKANNATSGNLAALNANGDLIDSGSKASDFSTTDTIASAYYTGYSSTGESTIRTITIKADFTGYSKRTNNHFPLIFKETVSFYLLTYSTLMFKLTVNETTSEPLYIDGSFTRSNNLTIQAGVYWVYCSSSGYYLRTDGMSIGKINGSNIGSAMGKGVVTTVTDSTTSTDLPTAKAVAEYGVEKADKVSGATSGNLAELDANGNLTDSGKALSGLANLGTLAYTKDSPATITGSRYDAILVFNSSTADNNIGIWYVCWASATTPKYYEIKASSVFTVSNSGATVSFTYTGSASGTMYMYYVKVNSPLPS